MTFHQYGSKAKTEMRGLFATYIVWLLALITLALHPQHKIHFSYILYHRLVSSRFADFESPLMTSFNI